jgi:hypothetical protein
LSGKEYGFNPAEMRRGAPGSGAPPWFGVFRGRYLKRL